MELIYTFLIFIDNSTHNYKNYLIFSDKMTNLALQTEKRQPLAEKKTAGKLNPAVF